MPTTWYGNNEWLQQVEMTEPNKLVWLQCVMPTSQYSNKMSCQQVGNDNSIRLYVNMTVTKARNFLLVDLQTLLL